MMKTNFQVNDCTVFTLNLEPNALCQGQGHFRKIANY